MKITKEQLEKLLWEQDSLHLDVRGWRFVVEVEGNQYFSTKFINDMPEVSGGSVDYDMVYSNEYEPYTEAVEDLLEQINK